MTQSRKRHETEPLTLGADDPGDASEQFSLTARAQNDAFRAAMLRAMARGKETVTEGVKTADPADVRYVKPISVASHVFTASSLNII
jgi:hypothetical protein